MKSVVVHKATVQPAKRGRPRMVNTNVIFSDIDKDRFFNVQNELIDLGYDLNYIENNLIKAAFNAIANGITENRKIYLRMADIREHTGCDKPWAYRDVKNALNTLMDRKITITRINPDTGTLEHTCMNWVITTKYIEGDAGVEIELHPNIEAYILQIDAERGYTRFALREYFGFKHPRSTRMYDILKRWAFKGSSITLTLEQLRYLFQAEGQYPLYADLKKRILEPTKHDINTNGKNTEFTFDYKEVKNGKKVVAVQFTLTPKKIRGGLTGGVLEALPEPPIDWKPIQYFETRLNRCLIKIETLKEIIENEGRRDSTLRHKLANPEYIDSVLSHIEYRYMTNGIPNSDVNNIGGLTRIALVKGLGVPTNEYEQDQLEKQKFKIQAGIAQQALFEAERESAAAQQAEEERMIRELSETLTEEDFQKHVSSIKQSADMQFTKKLIEAKGGYVRGNLFLMSVIANQISK